jgi:hypothetical protein
MYAGDQLPERPNPASSAVSNGVKSTGFETRALTARAPAQRLARAKSMRSCRNAPPKAVPSWARRVTIKTKATTFTRASVGQLEAH